MDTFLVGGGNNETFDAVGNVTYLLPPQKFEAGTLTLAGIFGFRKAIEFLLSIGLENIHNHENELKQYALDKLKNCHDLIIYNKNLKGSILTFNKVGVFAQDEATLLNYKGIAVRSGKHCAKALDKFLNVSSTVRASFYLYNTKEDVDILVDALINGGDFLDAYFHD